MYLVNLKYFKRTTTSDLLFIELNGPPLELWEAQSYDLLWLKDNHQTADIPVNRSKDNDNEHSKNNKAFYNIFNYIF